MAVNVNANTVNLKLDLRYVVIFLLVVIAGMLAFWRPWSSSTSADRTISETGDATIKATPDEYVFYPSFESTVSDQTAAKAEVTKTTNEVVDKLKELGVKEEDLTLTVYGYDDYDYTMMYYPSGEPDKFTASASIEIVVSDKDLAQKVQDYLDTTSAKGQLTPQAQFSESKQAELESQARQEAIDDAKAKAEQSAGLLGAKVGDVLTVSEGSGFDIYPLMRSGTDATAEDIAVSSTLPILPGQNEFSYTVSVTFALR
jgi:hypothetical protein